MRLLAAVEAILDDELGTARHALAELRLDLADARCDRCAEPFRSEAELHDAVAARRIDQPGLCAACLRKETWR